MPIEPTIVLDELCNTIAKGLELRLNELSQTVHGFKLVRTTRDWNDQSVPLTDYPVLKVYRNSPETFAETSLRTQVLISVEYITLLKKDVREVPFLHRIGKYIHNYIGHIDGITLDKRGYARGYLNVANQPNVDPVRSYTYTVSVIDSSVPSGLVDILIG